MKRVSLLPRFGFQSVGILSICVVLAGCGSRSQLEIGRVSGTVTLDGQPLPNAKVKFSPTAQGRGSYASTDASGRYNLYYTYDQHGALIGEHTVTINSEKSNDESPKDPLLPGAYNAQTKLKAHVKEGSNTIDFPLSSNGQIPSL